MVACGARYLTGADLTGVIGWVEAVTWAVHSALEHAVCTQRHYNVKRHVLGGGLGRLGGGVGVGEGCSTGLPTGAHRAALSGHVDEVDARGQAAHLGAGGHAVGAHAGHAGGGVSEPAAALGVLLPTVHAT